MQIVNNVVRFFRRILRILLRPVAVLCLLIATIALASDMTKSSSAPAASGEFGLRLTPIAEHWRALAPQSLAALQATVQRTSHKLVWTGVIAPTLQVPTWILFGATGLLAAFATRKRREVNIYSN
jgi:hypothetical protein